MALKEEAEKHYEEFKYPFYMSNSKVLDAPGRDLFCSTKVAKELGDALDALGATNIVIEATHPEFLGWTVQEIMDNWPPEPEYPDWLMNLDRETMIRALIEGDIEINGGDGDWFLSGILRTGCIGYDSWPDSELRDRIAQNHLLEDASEEEIAETLRVIQGFAARYPE